MGSRQAPGGSAAHASPPPSYTYQGIYATPELRALLANWAHDGADCFRSSQIDGTHDDGSGVIQREIAEQNSACEQLEGVLQLLPSDHSVLVGDAALYQKVTSPNPNPNPNRSPNPQASPSIALALTPALTLATALTIAVAIALALTLTLTLTPTLTLTLTLTLA